MHRMQTEYEISHWDINFWKEEILNSRRKYGHASCT